MGKTIKQKNRQRRHDDNDGGDQQKLSAADKFGSSTSAGTTEIDVLCRRVVDEAPDVGYTGNASSSAAATPTIAFASLPISKKTIMGLDAHSFVSMTDIQAACIPHALAGRDVLGAARTGSGKTLSFLIPIIECLYRHHFSNSQDVGCIVLSPTRELALQSFRVLRQIGSKHTFTAGLLIGGANNNTKSKKGGSGGPDTDFAKEQQSIIHTNIIMATPGRLLQHLEQTPYFDISTIKLLVLDEADRILDMGFRTQLTRILEYLPANDGDDRRQTLLFSATQTRNVKSLATLSLHKPVYIGVHEAADTDGSATNSCTPANLQQSYIVVPQQHKLNALYSFIKTHLKSKTIIFMSTCAQIRHAHDLLCSLRPGIPVSALHGKISSQAKRTQIYFDYCNKEHAVLLATDIAARGLDFPNVDWVVQVDAPEDRDMYIHRAGRTARYRRDGKALLMITPSEESNGFISNVLLRSDDRQRKNQIQISKLNINPEHATVVTDRAAALVASNVTLNHLAKKAFQSYLRSIQLMPLYRSVFTIHDIDMEAFGASLGLAATPNLQFLKAAAKDRVEFRKTKNSNKKLMKLKEQIKEEKLLKKLQKMKESNNDTAASTNDIMEKIKNSKKSTTKNDDDSDDDDELLVSKSKTEKDAASSDDDDETLPDAGVHEVTRSKRRKHTISIDGMGSSSNKHMVFNEAGDGEESKKRILQSTSEQVLSPNQLITANDEYLEQVKQRLLSTKSLDEEEHKDRVRQKHKKRRLEAKSSRANNDSNAVVAVLGGASSADNSDDDDSQSSSNDDDIVDHEAAALALIRGEA